MKAIPKRKRQMSKPFMLSVKAIVRDERDRCLLLRRAPSSKHNAGAWDFPGGKIDAGETFDSALIREIQEETGLCVELEAVVGSAQSELSDRIVAYLILRCRLASGRVQLSNEHTESAWVTVNELTKYDLCEQFRSFAAGYARARAD
jgi:8-oxo-dGTP diphosphatase